MKRVKIIFKIIGLVLGFYFIAMCYGYNASLGGYQVGIYNFLRGTNNLLGPDFSEKIGVGDLIFSIIYILAWIIIAFLAGKKEKKTLFYGMITYSAMPFLGLLGYFFISETVVKPAAMLLWLTFVWAYPYYPLIITQNSVNTIIVPMGIALFLAPIVAFVSYYIGKKNID
ncbi:MAG: hypothetical protein Q8882_03230 [Bacillota bacterium]|nr:hypothetical protein [Bacillota bacterium]